MAPTTATVQDLADWIQQASSAGRVEHQQIVSSQETLFRIFVHGQGWPHPEFTIVDALFDHHSTEQIKEMLDTEQLIARSLNARRFRFRLGPDGRAPDLEVLVVQCDGRRYRVTRGLNKMVVIYDDTDVPLPNIPPFPALPARIFDRPIERWCHEIRLWRRPA